MIKEMIRNRDEEKVYVQPSLSSNLRFWASIHPEWPCLVETETGHEYSYGWFLAAVQKMQRALGTAPRCIFLSIPGGAVNAVLWIAALTGGHTLVPLSPEASIDEKRRAEHMHKPDVLIVEQAEDAQGFTALGTQVITLQTCETFLLNLPDKPDDVPVEFAEGSVCLMTSGTTGEPKGVVLTEQQIAWTAEQIRLSHRLAPGDRGLTPLPFFHINAPVVSLCTSLLAGSSVVIARKFSRHSFWSWVENYGVTWVSIVPTILAMLLETERPAFLPGTLRFVRTASAPLSVVHLRTFEARFGIPVIETYGLTEAASQVAANPVPPGIHKPGSVGLPVGIALRVCQLRQENTVERLHDVAPGEVGEICVRGPSVISAYYGDAGKASFQDGWFRTGDLGYRDEDGYIYITGRLRDVIIRGGENIAPREIEEVLQAHPAVKEVAVVGRPDEIYGEQVVAYVVARSRWKPQIVQSLREYAAHHLSPQKVPIELIPIDALPRNATGKIQHEVLKEREVQKVKGCLIGASLIPLTIEGKPSL